ncbi:MAG: hypothetical protein ACD_48C00685G0002 [uncultured bacterium]|nr:MAG: hypothetical protein ACD_48C00685G0002 [uncultured bacterium]
MDYRSELHQYLENRIVRITTYSSFFLCVLTLCIPLFYWKLLPPFIPLWFSRPWGLERLTSVFGLFLPPLSCLFWLITTISTSIRLLKEHLVFSQILSVVTLIISIMSFITVTTIITLVI